jgi:hypothetical protein
LPGIGDGLYACALTPWDLLSWRADSLLTRIATPNMLRAVRCAETRPRLSRGSPSWPGAH